MSPPPIDSFDAAFDASLPRPESTDSQKDRRNFERRLSLNVATLLANGLRPAFPGILPDQHGATPWIGSRTSRRIRRLDVAYSTPELGLGLGLSIKTIQFFDPKTKCYSKRIARVDDELRHVAMDYHVRQPHSVLVAVIILPIRACDGLLYLGKGDDGFDSAVWQFRRRVNRRAPSDEADLFERVFIGLYDRSCDTATASVSFFDVMDKPPRNGRPAPDSLRSLPSILGEITATYDHRNMPPFEYA